MRVAIVGSRKFTGFLAYQEFLTFLEHLDTDITHIVSGGAMGADTLAFKYARDLAIPITVYFPNWNKHGKSAGMIRNKQIVDDCELVIAFPGPNSVGTRGTIKLAVEKGIPVHTKEVDQ